MRRIAVRFLALVAPLWTGGASAAPAGIEAGFAVVELAPDRAVPLGGYAARRGQLSEGIHDPVEARALVLREGETSLAIVSLDLAGVSAALREEVLRRAGDLDLDELVLAATHNHSGPGALTPIPAWRPAMGRHDPALEAEFAARVERAVREAHAALAPARLAHASVRAEGLQRNRATEGAGVDPTLGVLRIDGPDGAPRVVVVHFAAHPTILGADSLAISADWPGALRSAVERETGARALFLNGAMGDVAPVVPAEAPDPFERARLYGEAVARAAVEAIRSLDRAREGPAPSIACLGTLSPSAHTAFGTILGRPGGSALVPGEPFALPVTRLRLGGLDVVTAPGEPTQVVGRAMGMGPDRWVVSCAQDHLGYFADRDLYRRGGYEAEMSFFGPRAAVLLAQAARGEAQSPREEAAEANGSDPVRISGESPFRLGYDHGSKLGSRIRDLLAATEVQVRGEVLGKGGGLLLAPMALSMGVPAKDLVAPALVRAARRVQPFVPPDLLDEMEGIADGAGVPYDAILVANAFVTLAEQPDPSALLRLPARCTNLVATGEATATGGLLHVSSLDWGMGEILKSRSVVLVVEPPEGHPFVSVTWPGMVGTLRAMGAQGIAITEESCAADDDSRLAGLPVSLLMRDVVQRAGSLDEAVGRIREAPGTCGYKVTVSDGRRLDARVVEVTASRSHVRAPQAGLLFGCDPASPCEGECDPAIPRDDHSSARRYPAARRILEPLRGRIRVADLEAALASTEGGILNDETLLACSFEPQVGRFAVALGDAVDPEGATLHWTRHDLLALLSPERAAPYRTPWPVEGTGNPSLSKRMTTPAGLEVFDLEFDSPVSSGRPFNDRVKAEWFVPASPRGAVVVLPPWKMDSLAGERLVALHLARSGIATLILPLPWQAKRAAPGVRSGDWTLSHDLARTREALLQGAADAARAAHWLDERGFPAERRAILGISLGGHVASVAMGAYPRGFGAGVFLLAGAGIDRPFLSRNGTTDGIVRRLADRGVTPEEALDLVGALDPGIHCRPDCADCVLLVGCREDPVVPPESVEDLARAWGGARIDWYEGDHYGLLRSLGTVLDSVAGFLTSAMEER
jgi:hypothetical protein